jgi:Flp pilus assembly protein TadD
VSSSRNGWGRGVVAATLVLALGWHVTPAAQAPSPLLAPIANAMSESEASLKAGRYPQAEARYAQALTSSWQLMASLEAASGRPGRARSALARSSAPLADTVSPNGRVPAEADAARVAGLSAPQRQALRRDLATVIGGAYFNLGVLAAQQGRFDHAAAMLTVAAEQGPDLPGVQSALGIASFNAQRYEAATGPLTRALAADPGNADLRRMLALAWLNVEAYDKAVALLKDDPQRQTDSSLQYAYGMALVRSGHAAEAERIFRDLVGAHADSAELNVILGEAQAEQGDFDAAAALLQHALQLKPDVADANAALGTIYFKQGRFAEAEQALRAELRVQPQGDRARQMLATVLDLQGKGAEAEPLLRAVLTSRPDSHDARYLLGKILLAQGKASEAVDQLTEAVRLRPDDASAHYQLAQALRRVGQNDRADAELARYRELKDTQRGRRP